LELLPNGDEQKCLQYQRVEHFLLELSGTRAVANPGRKRDGFEAACDVPMRVCYGRGSVTQNETALMRKYPAHDAVHRVATCQLRVGGGTWDYASANAASVDEAWQRATAENPGFFNGVIHLVDDLEIDATNLRASLLATDFKSYLFWREAGFPETGVLDGFGSALIKSSDGAILLGRQRAGNINGGLAYLPGGFIDGRDVDGAGRIDIAASIARELEEETGLTPADLQVQPGFLVTQTRAHISIAVTCLGKADATALKARIERHIAADPASELTEIVIVRRAADLQGLAMPDYARVLVTWLLAEVKAPV
jgi:ADP-ribose pyrophosphatase YjhB (NUDIX family)